MPAAPPAAASQPFAQGVQGAAPGGGASPAAMPRGWTALQAATPDGQQRTRTRAELSSFVAEMVDDLLRTPPSAVPPDDPVLLRLTLQRAGIPLGELALGQASLRWTPAAGGSPEAFAAPVEPAVSRRLRTALSP